MKIEIEQIGKSFVVNLHNNGDSHPYLGKQICINEKELISYINNILEYGNRAVRFIDTTSGIEIKDLNE